MPLYTAPQAGKIDQIEREILAGLPNELGRLEDALFNLEFYQGDFSRWSVREEGQTSDSNRYQRNSQFMRRVVLKATDLLYRKGPIRKLPDHPEASEWLDHCYKLNGVDAILQEADRLTHVSDVAAIQVEPTEDPDCPIKLRLWDASCFIVWCASDDPCVPVAVATRDKVDAQRRLRLWTHVDVRTYLTDRYDEITKTAGATAYKRVDVTPHPFGRLPFAFVHYSRPVTQFWTPGPGTHLRLTNDWINKRATDLFDACRYNLNPIVVFKNVRPGFQPSRPVKPGDHWTLLADTDVAGDGVGDPSAEYLQADPSFVAAGWDDLNSAIDHELEMQGISPATIRLTQERAASGAAIVAEQLEPVKAAEGRRNDFEWYEHELARVVLAVGGVYLKGPSMIEEYTVTGAQLTAAAQSPGLVLSWPSLFPKLPGSETDQSDQWLLDNALTSRKQLVMDRFGFTDEEADVYLDRIAKELTREQQIFGLQDQQQQQQQNSNGDMNPPDTIND